MRKWLEYSLDIKKKNFNNQFLYSDYLLKKDKPYLDKMFSFKKFKKNRLFFTHYKFFKNKVKNNTIFLCSGYGFYEYFLKKKFKNFFISDVNIIYKKFNLNNRLSKFKKIDVLKISDFKKIKFKPNVIVLNNVEYLLNDKQISKCMSNISLFASNKTNIYVIFRSRYYLFLKFYDNILLPAELIFKQFILSMAGKKKTLNLNLHGFRRTREEFENLIRKRFKIINLYQDLFTIDYERSLLVKKLRLSNFLKLIFFKSHPYLHIYKLKKRTWN